MLKSRNIFICFLFFYMVNVQSANCRVTRRKFAYLYGIDTNRTQSDECHDLIFRFPMNGTIPVWAIQMFDATAKLQSGLLSGNVMNLGDYDECLSIDYPEAGVKGKYCLAAYDLYKEAPLIFGICLPEVCNLGAFLPVNENILIRDDLCQTNESVLDGGDIFCILVIVASILLVLFATFYEFRNKKQQASDVSRVLTAFSMYSNSLKLFKINPSEISCLYGIRVFSMLWIILGHRTSIMMGIPSTNIKEVDEIKYTDRSNYFYAANFAVDTFFLLSGFLVTYNTLKNGKLLKMRQLPQFIIHRWLRVFPSVAVLFLIIVTISRRVGSGPVYQLGVETARQSCVHYWWSYFLFIQNYINYDKLCLAQTWYLSVDLQMHVLSPLVLIPLGKLLVDGKTYTIRIMFILLITMTIFLPLLIALNWESPNTYMTQGRLSIFLLGIFGGIKAIDIQSFKLRINNKKLNLFIWIIVLVSMFLICSPSRYMIQEPTSVFTAMLATFGRPIWGICLLWIILNCMAGQCPLINQFLSMPLFEIMSRLTFSMYLLHNLEIGYHLISSRSSLHFSEFIITKAWISDVIITSFFAYIWTMLYEIPIIHLDKILFEGNKETPLVLNKNKHINHV